MLEEEDLSDIADQNRTGINTGTRVKKHRDNIEGLRKAQKRTPKWIRQLRHIGKPKRKR